MDQGPLVMRMVKVIDARRIEIVDGCPLSDACSDFRWLVSCLFTSLKSLPMKEGVDATSSGRRGAGEPGRWPCLTRERVRRERQV